MSRKRFLEAIKVMSVLELSELVKALEDQFGVSAAAPVAMAVPSMGQGRQRWSPGSSGGRSRPNFPWSLKR